MIHESKSVKQTESIAAEVARGLRGGEVVALEGELGAGKTQFVRGLVRGLGGNARAVSSPTFVLLNVAIGDHVRPLGDSWLAEATDSVAQHQPTQLIVPINVRGEIYGAILIGYHTPHHFSKEDAQLAMSVADQTALAIDNARL